MSNSRAKVESGYSYSHGVWSGGEGEAASPNSLGIVLFRRLHSRRTEIFQIEAQTKIQLTFEAIRELSVQCAQHLQEDEALVAGDIITVCSDLSHDTVVLLLGAIFLGVTINIIPNLEKPDIRRIIARVQPKLIICDTPYFQKFHEMFGDHVQEKNHENFKEKFCTTPIDTSDKIFKPKRVNVDTAILVLMCTSGTTGSVKILPYTHQAMRHAVFRLKHVVSQYDVLVNFAPIVKCSAIWTLILCIVVGAQNIIDTWTNASGALRLINKYKVTCINITPKHLTEICQSPKLADYPQLKKLRVVWARGEHCCVEQLKFIRSQLECVHLINIYECHEIAGMITHFDPIYEYDMNIMKVNSTGRLCRGCKAQIVDTKTGRILGPNEEGELWLKTTCMIKEYFDSDNVRYNDNSSSPFADGWYKTGDLGKFDSDQCLFVVGRITDLMSYEMNLIIPQEIEFIIVQMPGVKDCCVMGIPDPIVGHLPVAFVVKQVRPEITENEITKAVALNGEDYQRLRGGVYFLPHLPYSGMDKIVRSTLAKLIESFPPKNVCKCMPPEPGALEKKPKKTTSYAAGVKTEPA